MRRPSFSSDKDLLELNGGAPLRGVCLSQSPQGPLVLFMFLGWLLKPCEVATLLSNTNGNN